MCTARAKLKEIEQEMDCVYAELRAVKIDHDQAIEEAKVSELNYINIRNHNMLLTRNADVSNFCMISCLVITFIVLGLFVYVL